MSRNTRAFRDEEIIRDQANRLENETGRPHVVICSGKNYYAVPADNIREFLRRHTSAEVVDWGTSEVKQKVTV